MKHTTIWLMLGMFILGLGAAIGCGQDKAAEPGTLERLGKQADENLEDLKENAQEAKEDLKEGTEEFKENVEETVEDAKENFKDDDDSGE